MTYVAASRLYFRFWLLVYWMSFKLTSLFNFPKVPARFKNKTLDAQMTGWKHQDLCFLSISVDLWLV